MTTNQLRQYFNTTYQLGEWPKTYEVDHETYANVCHFIFQRRNAESDFSFDNGAINLIRISVGKNSGLFFKNVELMLKGKDNDK